MFFLLLPFGFLKVFHRVPIVNLALIAACVLAFGAELLAPGPWIQRLILYPADTHVLPDGYEESPEEFLDNDEAKLVNVGWTRQPWAFVTHAFLHADIFHLAGNLAFLFVFGCGLNADLGHLRYLGLYLLFAVAAGAGHILLSDAGVLGASGAICGVTGMVAAFYPRNDVRIWYLVWVFVLFRTGTFEVSALWAIAMWFGFDLWGGLRHADAGVAYFAHVFGSLAGFGVGLAMLKMGWFESDGYDVVSWYMGGKVGKLSRKTRRSRPSEPRRAIPAPPDRGRTRNAAAGSSGRWEEIPLAADAVRAGGAGAAAALESGGGGGPEGAGRRLEAFFAANPRASGVSEFDRPGVLAQYRGYLDQSTRRPLSNRALAGVARVAVAEGDFDLAVDAYTRLVFQLKAAPEKQAAAALEAARATAQARPKQAKQYLSVARQGPLTEKQKNTVAAIVTKLAGA